jgi:peroxiredoxin
MNAFYRSVVFLFISSINFVSTHWVVQTMDYVVVGRHTKQKKSDTVVWHNCAWFVSFTHSNTSLMIKIFLAIVGSIALMICCSNSIDKASTADLPELAIKLKDGSRVNVKNLPGKIALILFFPDCDHCQREAAQIQKNIAGFKDYNLYFISSANFEDINHFAQTYQLANYKNVFFAKAEAQDVIKAFGPIETPTIYLFDKTGKMIETFSGEVAIEVVLKYI